MTRFDDDAVDELMRLVGAEVERQDDALAYQSEAFLAWLAKDLRAGMSSDERARDARDAELFARRAMARLAARRVERRLPQRELNERAAPISATVAQAIPLAREQRCAVLLELAAAAGAGRALWDEPCDTWVELPPDLPAERYVALRVEGDSMEPVLSPRDVILVQLDTVPAVDDLVVARRPEEGFVVKRVASLTSRQIELASLNAAYEPVTVRRTRSTILGTVVARFARR
ncbi:MAG: S24 family peptidase [Gemmatimonadaceae bacterium]|nr:S24 family peptidase [Gemmatimonadaceae bacterium]NUO95716.1 S24 family peptidase [Gemmatimonadaceae bacterium]NUP57356.1 S24 family peptidase [Gemmatimonadaceae bacterium]NUP70520.1 S24 family peptidase [Gemmatimonadaceae bacterium]NUR34551.1 S24 family peptidase [Gemmatimonadaceae bacterium]